MPPLAHLVMTRPEASSYCSCDWSIVDKRTGATDVSYQVMMAVSVQVGRLGSGHLSQVRMFCYMGPAYCAPPCPLAVCPACCRWDWPGEGGSCLPPPPSPRTLCGGEMRAEQGSPQDRHDRPRDEGEQTAKACRIRQQCHNATMPTSTPCLGLCTSHIDARGSS